MSVSVILAPGYFQLARNPIIARFNSNMYYATLGAKARIKLKVTGTGAVAGEYITLPWGLDSVTFTFAASLDNSGTKLRTAGVLSLANFILQLAQDIAENYHISTNYKITTDSSGVILQAINKGSDYSFTGETETMTDGVLEQNSAGVDEQIQDNFKIYTELWVEDVYLSGNYYKKTTLELDAVNGVAQVDLQTLLLRYTQNQFPSYRTTSIVRASYPQKRYYIRYAEKYGTTPEVKAIKTGDVSRVLRAACSYEEFPGSINFFDDYILPAPVKFLTLQPRTKYVNTTQQEYLYYMVPDDSYTSIYIELKVYWTDGTDGTSSLAGRTIASEKYNIYMFPTGYDALDVGAVNPAKTVSKYQVKVIATTGMASVNSEAMVYIVDSKKYIDEQVFQFIGSQAGCDTLWCKGKHTDGIEVEKEVAEKLLQYTYQPVNGQRYQYFSQLQDVKTQTTGWYSREYINYLREFLLSEAVRQDVDGEWVPVIINPGSWTLHQSQQNLYALSFEYVTAFSNQALRGDIPAADLGDELETPSGDDMTDPQGSPMLTPELSDLISSEQPSTPD